jgi:hypothetical protein
MIYTYFLSLFLFLIATANSNSHPIIPMHQTLFIGNKGTTLSMLQKRFKAKKPAIYVDFHDVIAIKKFSVGVKNFVKKELKTATSKAKFVGRVLKTALNPVAIAQTLKLALRKNKITENYFNVIKKYGSKKLHAQAITLSTEIYEPNTPMIELLYKLKAAGHKIYLFSNGGYATMHELKTDSRFKHLFEGPDPLFTENSINTSYQDVYTLEKPDPAAFEYALARYNETAEYAIFIDDTREKLYDWRNKVIQQKYPHATHFWACSLLYDVNNHAGLELMLKHLSIL